MTFFDFASKTKIRVKAALFCALLPFAFGSCTDIFQQADASVLTDAAVIGSGESAAVLTQRYIAYCKPVHFSINFLLYINGFFVWTGVLLKPVYHETEEAV